MMALLPRPALLPQTPFQRLFLVTAPAGFGKTSLLRLWAEPRAARWLTLTPEHNDLPFFEEALTAARGNANALVLDDLHVIENEAVCARLEQLCEVAELQLAIGTRHDPGLLALGRHRVRQTLWECRAEELAFRGPELTALLQTQGLTLTTAVQEQMERSTGGWAAAIILVGEWLRPLPAHQQAQLLIHFPHTNSTLYDYLAQEVLSRLDSEHVTCLEEASVLSFLDTNSHRPSELQEAERSRLLTLSYEGVWELHPLLRAHLQTRLTQRSVVVRRWAEQLSDLRVLPLWAELGEWERLAEALIAWAKTSTSWWVVRPWVLRVPPPVRDRYPYLWRILSRLEANAGQVAEAEAALLRAEHAFQKEGAADALVLCQLDRGLLLRGQQRWEDVGILLEAILPHLTALPERLQLRYWADRAVYLWEAQHDRQAARAAFACALSQARAQENRTYQALLLINHAFALDLTEGAFARVFAAADQLEALYAGAPPADDRMFAAQLRAQAGLALGDPRTPQWLGEAIAAAEEAGYPTAAEYGYLALWHAEQGATAGAYAALAQAEDTLPGQRARLYLDPHSVAVDTLCRAETTPSGHNDIAEALRRAGKQDLAWESARQAELLAQTHDAPFEAFRARLCQALLRPNYLRLQQLLDAAQQPTQRTCLLQRYRRVLPALLQNALSWGVSLQPIVSLLQEASLEFAQIQTYGELQVAFNGLPPVVWPRPKTKALFAYLLLAGPGAVHNEQVREALWPELDPERARQNYHVHCSNLRRVIGSARLETTQTTIRLCLPAILWRDDLALQQALHAHEDALAEQLLQQGEGATFLVEFLYEDWSGPARAEREQWYTALRGRVR